MQKMKSIRIRPLEVSDFAFIQRLASNQSGFTIPPSFVLWLLSQTNSQSCMVAEHVRFGPVAYLLSLPVSELGKDVLYVWQFAASERGRRASAIHVLLLSLRRFVRRSRVKQLLFTAVPESPELRAIRRYAYVLGGTVPRSRQQLPLMVSQTEHEYLMKVAR